MAIKGPYAFSEKSHRFHHVVNGKLGSFVSRAEVQDFNLKLAASYAEDLTSLTKLMTSGKLSLKAWEESTARTLKSLWLTSYTVGRGGKDQMAANDYLAVGRYLKEEYQYLHRFAKQIAAGEVSVEQALSRIELYGKRANKTGFDAGDEQVRLNAGAMFSRRNLHAGESCEDCIAYAKMGWQPIGVLPLPGNECQCLSNCNCSISYSKTLPAKGRSYTFGPRSSTFAQIGLS